MGMTVGNQATIDGTLATLAEFPDRQLLGEDVIWSGDEDEGFLSSHRLVTSGTHTGHGIYGAPTGRSFTIRAIADCYCIADQITDEWLIRDGSGIAVQLGLDLKALVQGWIAHEGGPDRARRPFTPDQDRPGPYQGRGNENEWGHRLAAILQAIMDKDFAVIARDYDRAVRTEHPAPAAAGAEASPRRMDAPALGLSLRPLRGPHLIGREDPHMPAPRRPPLEPHGHPRRLRPLRAPLRCPRPHHGLTHAEWGPWGLRREFTLFDELAIWKQILLHTGEGA
jgi:hypothetical protein